MKNHLGWVASLRHQEVEAPADFSPSQLIEKMDDCYFLLFFCSQEIECLLMLKRFYFFTSELIIQVLQILFDEIFSLTCTHPHVSFTWMSKRFLKNILLEKLWVFKSDFSISFANTTLIAAMKTILLNFDEQVESS